MEKKAWAIMATKSRIGVLPVNFGCYCIYPSIEQAEAYVAAMKKQDEDWEGHIAEVLISL